jgi:type I restriction enzyme S subunit
MCYALQSESTIAQESLLINKTAQDGLYMGAAKEIVIAFPIDRDEQIRIKDFLNKLCRDIDTIISIKEKQLSDVRAHKKSLIYEYVTGKKRVTGYTN